MENFNNDEIKFGFKYNVVLKKGDKIPWAECLSKFEVFRKMERKKFNYTYKTQM